MNYEIVTKDLVQVEEMIALGLKHIADQERRITRLEEDLAQAQSLLQTFKQSQALHEEHRDRLLRELDSPNGAPARSVAAVQSAGD